jgi:hypothetical protein
MHALLSNLLCPVGHIRWLREDCEHGRWRQDRCGSGEIVFRPDEIVELTIHVDDTVLNRDLSAEPVKAPHMRAGPSPTRSLDGPV